MSSPPPPYGTPSPVPLPYRRPVPSRRRPSAWWFAVGGLLVVAGIVIGVVLVVQAVSGLFSTDATVDVDGRPHEVTVPTDGDRMLWVDASVAEPSCEIVDVGSGEAVVLRHPDATWTRDDGSFGEADGFATFDPGSGRLRVTCGPQRPTELSAEVEIGPAPQFGEFVGGLAAGVLLAIVLGGAGVVLLIVIGVLYATGRPRNVPAPQ